MNRETSSTDRPVDRLARWKAIDLIADAVQPKVRAWLDGTGSRAWIKDLLHGAPLGHPLHPLLTDVPIGAWTVTLVLDLAGMLGGDSFDDAADLSLGLGIAGGIAAALTGYVEWSDTANEPKRLGMVHAVANASALGCYAVSAAARAVERRGAGIAAAMAGYLLVCGAAYLGGELTLNYGIGTKHTSVPIDPPPDFTRVMALADLDDTTHRIVLEGVPVLLSRTRAGVSAISAVCTHRGAALEDGTFEDGCVRCPWHGARFRLSDGKVMESPAVYSLAQFETRIVDGMIELRPLA